MPDVWGTNPPCHSPRRNRLQGKRLLRDRFTQELGGQLRIDFDVRVRWREEGRTASPKGGYQREEDRIAGCQLSRCRLRLTSSCSTSLAWGVDPLPRTRARLVSAGPQPPRDRPLDQ